MVRRWGAHFPRGLATGILLLTASAQARSAQCRWNPLAVLQYQTCASPVDDMIEIEGHSPWTHQPFCLIPKSLEKKEKFCVYTSSSFNENTGISIIATPETAASVAEVVQNPTAAWSLRRYLTGRSQPAGDGAAKGEDLAYEIKAIPGKEMGVVATRLIRQFEVFMVGFPAIIGDDDLFPKGTGPAEGPQLIEKAIHQLPDEKRVLSLAKSGFGGVHVLDDIIRTNSFGVRINERGHMGLYPEIARLNHGCNPSAAGRFSPQTLAFEVIATRDIPAGEEITISYIPLGLATSDRADALERWGFNCTCSLCTAAPPEREASDRRRVRLTDIPFIMSDEGTQDAEMVALTREFVGIIKQEGLTREFGEYYHGLSALYYNRKDIETSIRYAKRALKYAEAFDDPKGEFCEGLRDNLAALETWRRQTK